MLHFFYFWKSLFRMPVYGKKLESVPDFLSELKPITHPLTDPSTDFDFMLQFLFTDDHSLVNRSEELYFVKWCDSAGKYDRRLIFRTDHLQMLKLLQNEISFDRFCGSAADGQYFLADYFFTDDFFAENLSYDKTRLVYHTCYSLSYEQIPKSYLPFPGSVFNQYICFFAEAGQK